MRLSVSEIPTLAWLDRFVVRLRSLNTDVTALEARRQAKATHLLSPNAAPEAAAFEFARTLSAKAKR